MDIRLITATSRNLEEAVQEGEFREDLYYRLNVVTISLPPLRERRQDISTLVEHFLHRTGRSASITPQALTKLNEYHWPGNVRELENTIERAIVLAREGVVTENEIELRPAACADELQWRMGGRDKLRLKPDGKQILRNWRSRSSSALFFRPKATRAGRRNFSGFIGGCCTKKCDDMGFSSGVTKM